MADVKRAIGLMSGTSLDGIDAAVIETDGGRVTATGAALTLPYGDDLRDRLKALLGRRTPDDESRAVEREMTLAQAQAVRAVMRAADLSVSEVDVIGFHGQTLFHAPEDQFTWQLGDGALLAEEMGIPVVADFRSADMRSGGQGAPLAPVYHQALSSGLEKPMAILNLGGVGNVTYLGRDGEMLAFDTGPANAPLDRWVERHTGARFDEDGKLSALGKVSETAVAIFLANPYFDLRPPKSLDRMHFDHVLDQVTEGLSLEDGAATLLVCIARSVAAAQTHFPETPKSWYVTGGGRSNPILMKTLSALLQMPVAGVESLGWNGEALEAQCFAYLAVRSMRGLPLSFPGTTGVASPTSGGRLFGGRGIGSERFDAGALRGVKP